MSLVPLFDVGVSSLPHARRVITAATAMSRTGAFNMEIGARGEQENVQTHPVRERTRDCPVNVPSRTPRIPPAIGRTRLTRFQQAARGRSAFAAWPTSWYQIVSAAYCAKSRFVR